MEKTKPVIVDETETLQATAKSGKTKYWQKQIVEIE
jgi:hypothetical protein